MLVRPSFTEAHREQIYQELLALARSDTRREAFEHINEVVAMLYSVATVDGEVSDDKAS